MSKATIEPVAVSEPIADGVHAKLALDSITLDPITDVRSGPANSKDEARMIDNLAKSIYEQGQLQPIVVRRNGKSGHYLLIAGRRRYAAVKLIAALAEKGQIPSKPEDIAIQAVIVDKSDDEAFSAALQENLQRKQFSPIELAQNIMEIKKRKSLTGEDWSKHVADFLRVSRATVTQHAKLLDLPADIRAKVHRGDLSAASAFDLYAVEEAKRDVVLKEAEKLAESEAAEKAARVGKGGKAATSKSTPQSASGKATPADDSDAEKGKVKRKHILEAARKTGTLTDYKPRTRNEIVGFFQEVLDSADPYAEPITEFAHMLVTRWALGKVGDRALLNKLDAINEALSEKKAKAKKTA